jgi:superfamily I DNA/RNA helicase
MFGEVPEHAKVSTLHALCFHALNMSRDLMADTMGVRRKFFESIGVRGTRGEIREQAEKALELYSRNRNVESEEYFDASDEPFSDPQRTIIIANAYQRWKKDQGYVDFTDLITRVANGEGTFPTWDVVIIDEAQDLTPLQWRLAERLYEQASTVYVVGDDDQTIYGFLGANVRNFLSWPCDAQRVLDYTHRLPKNILDYSLFLAKRIQCRQPKTVKGDPRVGMIWDEIDVLENLYYGTTSSELYLVRNEYMKRRIQKLLIERAIPFSGKFSPFTDTTCYGGRAFNAVRLLTQWRESRLQFRDWRTIKSLLSPSLVEYIEGKFVAAKEFHPDGIPTLTSIFKEPLNKRGFWEEFLPSLDSKLAACFKVAIEQFGMDRCLNPTLELCTIHKAKGKEANRVFVCSAVTDKIYRKILDFDDSEHRVFYVAITRAKEELYLINDEEAGLDAYPFPKP